MRFAHLLWTGLKRVGRVVVIVAGQSGGGSPKLYEREDQYRYWVKPEHRP